MNFSIKHCILVAIFFLLVQHVHSANWNSVKAGNWSDATTWAENAVPAITGNIGTVAINHNVTLNQNATVSTLEIFAGTLLTSGASTLTVTNLIVKNGAILHHKSTEARKLAITNFTIENGGYYKHEAKSHLVQGAVSDFPGSSTKIFDDQSTVEILEWGNSTLGNTTALAALPNSAAGWGNLILNVAIWTSGYKWNLNGSISLVKGDFTIKRTGPSRELTLFNTNSSNKSILIKGNLKVTTLAGSNVKVGFLNGGSGSLTNPPTFTINIDGNIIVDAGTLYLTNLNGYSGLNFININLKGNLIQSGNGIIKQEKDVSVVVDLRLVGTTEQFIDIEDPLVSFYAGINIGTASINSNVTVIRDFIINNSPTTANAIIVNSGSALKIQGTNKITGNIVLQIKAAASIIIEHTEGLEPVNGTTGAVRINGTTPGFPPIYPSESTNYSPSANYIFTGTSNQITGTGIPDNALGSIIIDKPAGSEITLSKPLSITGTFDLKNGIVNTTPTNLLTINSAGSLTGSFGNSSFINGPVRRYLNTANTGEYTFPVGYHNGTIFKYKPIIFTPTTSVSGTDYFDARFITGTSPSGELLGTNMIGKLVPEYWEFIPNSSSTTFGKVAINYTWPGTANNNWINPAGADIIPESNHNIAVTQFHDNGDSYYWNFTKPSNQLTEKLYTPGASNDGLVQSGPLEKFGIFTFGLFYDNVLPIIIKDFSLVNYKQIRWNVDGDKLIKQVSLEVSSNGIFFSTAERLNSFTGSADIGQWIREYRYYRIKVQSLTGDYIYSKVLQVINQSESRFSICNNGSMHPSLQIELSNTAELQYQVINQQGAILLVNKQQLLKGNHSFELKSNSLAKGVYYIQIHINRQVTNSLKLIIN